MLLGPSNGHVDSYRVRAQVGQTILGSLFLGNPLAWWKHHC